MCTAINPSMPAGTHTHMHIKINKNVIKNNMKLCAIAMDLGYRL